MRKNRQGKELRKLSRAELLELLLEQSKELEKVTKERDQYRDLCQQREIKIAQSGSIAEAALQLSGVFEAAQKAADDYVANIRMAHGDLPEEETQTPPDNTLKAEVQDVDDDPYPAQEPPRVAIGPA